MPIADVSPYGASLIHDQLPPKAVRTMDSNFEMLYSGRYVSRTRHMIGMFENKQPFTAVKPLAVRLHPTIDLGSDCKHDGVVYLNATLDVEAGSMLIKSHDRERHSGLGYTMRVPRAVLSGLYIPENMDTMQMRAADAFLRLIKPAKISECQIHNPMFGTILNPDVRVMRTHDGIVFAPAQHNFSRDVVNALGYGVHILPNFVEASRVVEHMAAVGPASYAQTWHKQRDAFNSIHRGPTATLLHDAQRELEQNSSSGDDDAETEEEDPPTPTRDELLP